MRVGIAVPNWGRLGDPRVAAELAACAEQAGWDAYFCWDGLPTTPNPNPAFDPWVILAAVAAATERIRIGTCIAVLARYKPHVVARTLASLDVLSGGRMILGVGIGDGGRSFEAFGEPGDARIRAQRLDEALEVVTRLWAGGEVTHRGTHFTVDRFTLAAVPIQQPRIPIWVGGDSAAAMRRAARWDGWIGPDNDPASATPDDLAAVRRHLEDAGADFTSFDLAWAGADGASSLEDHRRAGATWRIEVGLGSQDELMDRLAAGPWGG